MRERKHPLTQNFWLGSWILTIRLGTLTLNRLGPLTLNCWLGGSVLTNEPTKSDKRASIALNWLSSGNVRKILQVNWWCSVGNIKHAVLGHILCFEWGVIIILHGGKLAVTGICHLVYWKIAPTLCLSLSKSFRTRGIALYFDIYRYMQKFTQPQKWYFPNRSKQTSVGGFVAQMFVQLSLSKTAISCWIVLYSEAKICH